MPEGRMEMPVNFLTPNITYFLRSNQGGVFLLNRQSPSQTNCTAPQRRHAAAERAKQGPTGDCAGTELGLVLFETFWSEMMVQCLPFFPQPPQNGDTNLTAGAKSGL